MSTYEEWAAEKEQDPIDLVLSLEGGTSRQTKIRLIESYLSERDKRNEKRKVEEIVEYIKEHSIDYLGGSVLPEHIFGEKWYVIDDSLLKELNP